MRTFYGVTFFVDGVRYQDRWIFTSDIPHEQHEAAACLAQSILTAWPHMGILTWELTGPV